MDSGKGQDISDRLLHEYIAELSSVVNSSWDRCLFLEFQPKYNTLVASSQGQIGFYKSRFHG